MALPNPLAPFVAGQKVTAAEHMNPIRLNAENLDARLGSVTASNPVGARLSALESETGDGNTGNAALDTRLTTVETRTTDATSGNDALDDRLSTLEATPPGTAITYSGFLNLDPNVAGFNPSTTNAYEVYRSTTSTGGAGPTYLQFPNPSATVTVFGSVGAHLYSDQAARGGLKVEISLDGGVTWQTSATSPLAGVSAASSAAAAKTCYVGAQFSVSGIPTGVVRVRATAMRESTISGYFRATLYANMLGGAGATSG